jgi:hypothetical protein
MERRNLVMTLGVALLVTGPTIYSQIPSTAPLWVISLCGLTFLVGMALLLWSWLAMPKSEATAQKDMPKMARDTFNNFGNNSGHMGPVNITNVGRVRFSLTEERLREVIAACPKDRPVIVTLIGRQGNMPMLQVLVDRLTDSGLQVSTGWIGTRSPPPDRPLTVTRLDHATEIELAPDA